MGYKLDGKPLAVGRAFKHKGIQYPANWLLRSSSADRERLGITWEADPVPVDHRFYFQSGDSTPVPRDADDIRKMFIDEIKRTAASLLEPTDWKIIRANELNQAIDPTLAAYRAAVRQHSNDLEAEVNGLDFDALTAWSQHDWPEP